MFQVTPFPFMALADFNAKSSIWYAYDNKKTELTSIKNVLSQYGLYQCFNKPISILEVTIGAFIKYHS